MQGTLHHGCGGQGPPCKRDPQAAAIPAPWEGQVDTQLWKVRWNGGSGTTRGSVKAQVTA